MIKTRIAQEKSFAASAFQTSQTKRARLKKRRRYERIDRRKTVRRRPLIEQVRVEELEGDAKLFQGQQSVVLSAVGCGRSSPSARPSQQINRAASSGAAEDGAAVNSVPSVVL